jgi:hypothetical protein
MPVGPVASTTIHARGANILQGLASERPLDADGRMRVELLKVPHHGSQHNISHLTRALGDLPLVARAIQISTHACAAACVAKPL